MTTNICTDLLYQHAVYMVALEKYGTLLLYWLVGFFFINTSRKIRLAGDGLDKQKQSNIDEARVLNSWSYICYLIGIFLVICGTLTTIPKSLDVLAAQKIPPVCIEFSLLKRLD